MNVATLRKSIVAYYAGADFTAANSGGGDVVLDAVNQAKLELQQRVDFLMGQKLVKVVVGSGGAEFGSATEVDGSGLVGTLVSLRNAWTLTPEGKFLEVDLVSKATFQTRQRRLGSEECVERYPSDAQSQLSWYGERCVFHSGTKVFYYPFLSVDVSVVLDAVVWTPDYTQDSDSDFLLKFCSNYLKWAAIAELNPIFKEFVARQEGNVGPSDIDAKVTKAFDAVERWNAGLDAYNPVQR